MNLDDPKLTAYALGEITDPAEINEVEIWLATNSIGRTFVTETKEMAKSLGIALHSMDAPSLTKAQRAALLNGTHEIHTTNKDIDKSHESYLSQKANPRSLRRPWSIVALTALAACLAAAPLLPWTELLRLRDSSAPTVAFNDKPMTIQMPQETPARKENKADMIATDQGQFVASAPPADLVVDSLQLKPAIAQTPAPALGAASSKAIAGFSSGWMAGAGGGKAKLATRRDRLANDSWTDSSLGLDKDANRANEAPNTEAYDAITENDFLTARENPLSTFSIDVDTASYANVRRFLNDGQLPPKGAVRIEEMLNYFTYDYAKPEGEAPFSTHLEVASCPWQPDHRLVRIGLKGREIPVAERKAANLVFLIDVSGSMDGPERLPLVKQSLRLLVDQLAENDKITLAVYAGQSGLVLPATSDKEAIRLALENLQPSGSTNGASGIRLAYEEAEKHFIKDGVNRVILATDGDFNVGVTNQSDLVDLITEKAKSGVFLSVLGFGTGNLKDSTMEKLADKGNGNYAYIDSLREGKKVLVEQMGGTLITIAKDVKIQVEFNPAVVINYRLIGYENRALKKEDFADDKKDAGEIGAGHTVTALYEVVMVGSVSKEVKAKPLKYMQNSVVTTAPVGEMLTVKLRYKEPAGDVSKLLEFPLTDNGQKLDAASKDFQFASTVAEFGQLLSRSKHSPLASWESLIARASDSKGDDKSGYRAEFIDLAKKAWELTRRNDS